jgi:hypothetical protein
MLISKKVTNQYDFYLHVQVNINIGTATSYAINPMLILYYDSIIEIDTATKQVLMVQ